MDGGGATIWRRWDMESSPIRVSRSGSRERQGTECHLGAGYGNGGAWNSPIAERLQAGCRSGGALSGLAPLGGSVTAGQAEEEGLGSPLRHDVPVPGCRCWGGGGRSSRWDEEVEEELVQQADESCTEEEEEGFVC